MSLMHDDPTSPDVTVLREHEVSHGWRFEITIGQGVQRRSILLRLDWADYNRWSQGRLSPAEVAAGVIACAAAMLGAAKLPEQTDAATLRRRAHGFEDRLTAYLDR